MQFGVSVFWPHLELDLSARWSRFVNYEVMGDNRSFVLGFTAANGFERMRTRVKMHSIVFFEFHFFQICLVVIHYVCFILLLQSYLEYKWKLRFFLQFTAIVIKNVHKIFRKICSI